MQRPLMRWTMGNVSEAGWECLSESIRVTTKVYPEFDFVICHNNLSSEQVTRLSKMGIQLYCQKKEEIVINYRSDEKTIESVVDYFWKLAPPRLRPEAHEVWIDNDIIISERIEEIDNWLESDVPIISQSYGRELYGSYDKDIPQGLALCAGFFGLPPHFQFEEKLRELTKNKKIRGHDEQGLMAKLIIDQKDWKGIRPWALAQLGWWDLVKKIPSGSHFIRLNQGTNAGWETYKLLTHPSPKLVSNENWQYKEAHLETRGTPKQRKLIKIT